MISLPRGVNGGADLFLLLADNVLAAIHPLVHGFPGFTAAVFNVFTAFLRGVLKGIASFTARAGSVKHAHQRAKTESSKEPQQAVTTISIRHQTTSTS